MNERYEITIKGTPKTWNAFINKTHWAYYTYAKGIKQQITAAATPFRNTEWPLSCVRITFCYGFNTNRQTDIDSRCIKPHVDGLVSVGLLQDDHKEIVREVRMTWEKSKEPFTKIIIESL